jgi:hypothetical protein
MLCREVSIMLVQILRSSILRSALRPAAVVFVAVAASACNSRETAFQGELVVVPRGPDDECVTVPGRLQLDGINQAGSTSVSGLELCGNPFVRRELPAGLYSASWQPDSEQDGSQPGEAWALRDPAIINVLPGQTTTLRVRQIDGDAQLLSQVR